MRALTPHIAQIKQLCNQHHVSSLYAFGSVVTGRLTAKSDIDLIVAFKDMPVEQYANNYFDLKFSLEGLLSRPVDLLEEKTIKNPYFRQAVEGSRKLLY